VGRNDCHFFKKMEYPLSHIATGTVEVRLRIARPLRIFEKKPDASAVPEAKKNFLLEGR